MSAIAPINIYTYVDKRTDFIEWQLASLQKFCRNDFTYIVFNNGSNGALRDAINKECKRLNVQVVDIAEKNHDDPSGSHSQAIQWSWDNVITKSDKDKIIIDFDIFLFAPVNLLTLLDDGLIEGIPQTRQHVKYLWAGVLILSKDLPNKETINFRAGVVGGVNTDVGGNLHTYFLNNPDVTIKALKHTSHLGKHNLNLLPPTIAENYKKEFCWEIIEGTMLHYGRGTNWNNMSDDHHEAKWRLTMDFLDLKWGN